LKFSIDPINQIRTVTNIKHSDRYVIRKAKESFLALSYDLRREEIKSFEVGDGVWFKYRVKMEVGKYNGKTDDISERFCQNSYSLYPTNKKIVEAVKIFRFGIQHEDCIDFKERNNSS